ncbi:MAG: hypothetical protein KAH33_00825 [Candidatus Delongbacteria bacterium]|nr:hypothetical protein [Candidatus Delongbacteria bacterium]
MKKTFLLIFLIAIFLSSAYSQSQPDTLYFNFTDFYTHKIFSLNVNYSHDDSLSQFILSGNNKLTNYSDYSKNHNDINVLFLIKNKYVNMGGEINSNFSTNSTISKPTSNEFSLMPKIQLSLFKSTIDIAAGYTGKSNELILAKGLKWALDLNTTVNANDKIFQFNGKNNGNNLDKQINFYTSVNSRYFENLNNDLGNFSINGQHTGSQYHYYNTGDQSNRVNKEEYSLSGHFLYNIYSNLKNSISTRYFQRDKNIFVEDEKYSFNENVNIGLTDELSFHSKKITSSFKFEFDTGSDKFSHHNSKESFSFYTFQLNSNNSYISNIYGSSLSIKYFKHQYKSLFLSNSEDRDILKFYVEPSVSYRYDQILGISQSFPFEFYHLINISAEKSSSNYIDRIINSLTKYDLYKNKPINLSGKISIQSYFRSYDYDETFSKSFVIKNYALEDTLSYSVSERSKLQLSVRYKYEEFGNFNYKDFTENPINYKNHYYVSCGYIYRLIDKLNVKGEYYFYEIDAYNFDQTDFSNSFLTNVFIIHGPRLSSTFIYNKFSLFSSFNLDFYRDNETKYNFILRSGYSF